MISFPYTSVKTMSGSTPKYDRAINSSIKRLYNKLRYTRGVAIDIGDGFRVVSDTGMNVKVMCNGAWAHVGGNFCYEDDIEKSLTIQTADSNNDRIDRIVIRNDISQEVRAASIVVVKGTASSSPTPPALTNTSEIQEICLADILVKRNATSIATENITDKRLDKSVCGVLSNAFGDIDASKFFTQLQALIDNLKDEITDINQGSEVMLKATYDPGEHGIDITIQPYTHSLSGGVHTLTGQGNVIQFTATGNFTKGNTFNVNGTVCTANTISGEELWTGFFKSGATIMCLRSGNTLTFNGGGLPSSEVAKLAPGNIKTGVSVVINGNTVSGTFTADATAAESDIAPGKIAYSKGNKIIGTFTSDANAVESSIRSGFSAYVNGIKIVGNIPNKGAATIIPTPYDQSISAGQYLTGNQTIKGDANLAAQNIKDGISIFGVRGNYKPSDYFAITEAHFEGAWNKTIEVNAPSGICNVCAILSATYYYATVRIVLNGWNGGGWTQVWKAEDYVGTDQRWANAEIRGLFSGYSRFQLVMYTDKDTRVIGIGSLQGF